MIEKTGGEEWVCDKIFSPYDWPIRVPTENSDICNLPLFVLDSIIFQSKRKIFSLLPILHIICPVHRAYEFGTLNLHLSGTVQSLLLSFRELLYSPLPFRTTSRITCGKLLVAINPNIPPCSISSE